MLQDRLLLALIRSRNAAADDVLVEALRLGNDAERGRVLEAVLKKRTVRGLSGAVGLYDRLPEPLQHLVLRNVKLFYAALRESARGDDPALRVAAMRLIALGRQGGLAYILAENLHDPNDLVSRTAADSLLALAKWVAAETSALQRGEAGAADDGEASADPAPAAYASLMRERPEVEAAVARALDVHRGRHGSELMRAAALLIDSPASRAFQILSTPKHGGQTLLVRRLQQPPAAEHVDAFLLGASHGHLRAHFASALAHVAEAPVLDALLRRTHWLKDNGLAVCMHQVGRGAWWTEADLERDIGRRRPADAARVAEWIAASGSDDTLQDERLDRVRAASAGNFDARLRLLRVAASRRRGASVGLLKAFLADPDERLARLAAREIVRRRPPDYENLLLKLLTTAPDSVRRVVGRAIGQAGFEHFWNRFDRLPKDTRRPAGRAMMKLLPDATNRLHRRLLPGGPLEQRLKALAMVQELGLAEPMREVVVQLCRDADPRVRSKAILVAGDIPDVSADLLVERLLTDADARVRANTIEVVEARADERFVPVLTERARAAPTNRERANAIKALFRMRVSTVSGQLAHMLQDPRAEHRISAMWALRQVGWWQLLGEVGRLAKADENVRVRRYALTLLKGLAEAAGKAG